MEGKIYSMKLPEEMDRQHSVDALSRAWNSLDSLVSIFTSFITSGNTPRGWLTIEEKTAPAESQASRASLEIRGVVCSDGVIILPKYSSKGSVKPYKTEAKLISEPIIPEKMYGELKFMLETEPKSEFQERLIDTIVTRYFGRLEKCLIRDFNSQEEGA